MDWKESAINLFFNEHKKIKDIADQVGKTRKTVSVFLLKQTGFKEEKEERKRLNQIRRAEYKKEWERKRQNENNIREGEILKRQHNIDVWVLSVERH